MLRKIMDRKLQENLLDTKTYLRCLGEEVRLAGHEDKLQLFDKTYSSFVERAVDKGDLNFEQLNTLQKAILKQPEGVRDCNEVYRMCLEQGLRRMQVRFDQGLSKV